MTSFLDLYSIENNVLFYVLLQLKITHANITLTNPKVIATSLPCMHLEVLFVFSPFLSLLTEHRRLLSASRRFGQTTRVGVEVADGLQRRQVRSYPYN